MVRKLTLLAWIVLTLSAVAVADPGAPGLLAGSDKALWLITTDANSRTFAVMARTAKAGPEDAKTDTDKPAKPKWKSIRYGLSGDPAAACATGDQLHLILTDPIAYSIYDHRGNSATIGRNPTDPRWPGDARPIAMCPASGMPGTTAGDILAIVARTASGEPSRTDSGEPSRTNSTQTPPAIGVFGKAADKLTTAKRLGVFLRSAGEWKHLADYPDPIELSPDTKLLAATHGGTLYVMICDAESAQLLAWSGDNWQAVATDVIPEGSRCVALVSVKDELIAVLTAVLSDRDGRQLSLARPLKPVKDSMTTTLRLDAGNLLAIDSDASFVAARLGDGLAVAWRTDETLKIATCDIDGKVLDVDEPRQGRLDDSAEHIMEKFMWGLMLAILLPMFFMKSATPPGPFMLPEGFRPGNPIKRAIALLIDLLPWHILSAMTVLVVSGDSPEKIVAKVNEAFSGGSVPPILVYASISTMVLYTAYCIGMELRYGATLGKMAMKLRVIGDRGLSPEPRAILLRNLFRMVELMLMWVVIPSGILVFVTRRRQRLGDMIARTTVIDARYQPAPSDEEPSQGDVPPQRDVPPVVSPDSIGIEPPAPSDEETDDDQPRTKD